MFNLNRRFRNPFAKPQHHYARNGGGIVLPILAGLAYRYREPIMRFFRERFSRRGYSNPSSQTIA